jgi:hypothetical protein
MARRQATVANFSRRVHRPRLLGRKLLAVGGSRFEDDLAGMPARQHGIRHETRMISATGRILAARKRSSSIAGTKLLPRRPVLCAKCRPCGANLTRRTEWF